MAEDFTVRLLLPHKPVDVLITGYCRYSSFIYNLVSVLQSIHRNRGVAWRG
jgi:hypothetical protein